MLAGRIRFIYLSAAVIAVPLSKALGLGSIIGYLAAGIAIGPWGLGLVSDVQDILHFAEFGVVLMLFLVGLELEPTRLWNLRRPIFGWVSAQVIGCALAAVGMVFDISWRVALVPGLGLALSSTAIALQVMKERNLLPTTSGQSGFAILLSVLPRNPQQIHDAADEGQRVRRAAGHVQAGGVFIQKFARQCVAGCKHTP